MPIGLVVAGVATVLSSFEKIAKIIPIKGKFKAHAKFFYARGSTEWVGHDKYLMNSGLKLTDSYCKDLINGGLWRLCAQCVAAGGPKDWTFHIDDKPHRATIKIVTINGQDFDSVEKNVGGLPRGFPTELKEVFYVPENRAGETIQIAETTKPVSTLIETQPIEQNKSIINGMFDSLFPTLKGLITSQPGQVATSQSNYILYVVIGIVILIFFMKSLKK